MSHLKFFFLLQTRIRVGGVLEQRQFDFSNRLIPEESRITIEERHGFFSGLGAATADCIYGIIAVFGLTLISNLLIAHQFWLRLIGGIFYSISV